MRKSLVQHKSAILVLMWMWWCHAACGFNPPTNAVWITIDWSTVPEEGGGFNFIVHMATPANVTVPISFSPSPGFAYTLAPPSGSTVTSAVFTTATSTCTYYGATVSDNYREPNQTIVATITAPTGYVIWGSGSASTTIYDNDPMPTVSVLALDSPGPEGRTATFRVQTSEISGYAITVNYATVDGSATAGLDYVAASGQVTIPAYQSMQTFSVTVNGDLLQEAQENFAVQISNPVNATLGTSSATYLIDDIYLAVFTPLER